MATQTATRPTQTVEEKVQQIRLLYADAPPYAKTALENSLKDLTSFGSTPRAGVESAGRTGIRQGTVSELLVIARFESVGAEGLRALLELRNGVFSDTDWVGNVHFILFLLL